uniref:Uncharacterized protein n=1 Tax=Dictyoglomus turgidum TaxID=513050 RepID=A0A7C3WW23_9BACT
MIFYKVYFNEDDEYLCFKNIDNAIEFVKKRLPKEKRVDATILGRDKIYITCSLNKIDVFPCSDGSVQLVAVYDVIKTELVRREESIQEEVKEEGKPYKPRKKVVSEKVLKTDFPIFVEDKWYQQGQEDDGELMPSFSLQDRTCDLKWRSEISLYTKVLLELESHKSYKKLEQVKCSIYFYPDELKLEDEE